MVTDLKKGPAMESHNKRTRKKNPFLSRESLEAAAGKSVPDVIAPNLKILFCGINPGLYSAAVGHHFARPGNRFWPTLFAAGFTPRLFNPAEEKELLALGYGITNIVNRATASAGELSAKDLVQGGRRLKVKVGKFKPRILAVLGMEAFRRAFQQPHADPGPQPLVIGATRIWLLPNPSGLNAAYQAGDLKLLFRRLRLAAMKK
jgi:TDG/mug DNA glycosylase family protein